MIDPNDPNDPNKKNQPNPGVNQPGMALNRPKGSGFSSVKKIIGASGKSRIGEAVTGRLQEAGEQARAGIAGSRQQFQTQAQQQRQQTQQQQQAAQSALSGIMGVPGGAGMTPPTAQQQQATQSLLSGQYQGPTKLQDTETLRAKAAEAETMAQQAGTQYGRQQLLSQQFAQRGGYGARQSALDAMILGKTAGKQLAQAQSQVGGVSGELSAAEAGAQQTARALQQERAGYSKELMTGLQQQTAGLAQQATQRQAALAQQQQTQREKLLKALETGEVSAQDKDVIEKLKGAGITEGSYLGGMSSQDAQRFLDESAAPTAASVMTAGEFAKMKALEQLGGSPAAGKLAPSVSQFKGKEKDIGTYDPTKAVEFKKGESGSKIGEELKTRQQETQKTYEQSKQTEDAHQGAADIVNAFGASADVASRMNFGQRNLLKSMGIEEDDGEWTMNGVPVHPNDISARLSQRAQEARVTRQETEGRLGKKFKIK